RGALRLADRATEPSRLLRPYRVADRGAGHALRSSLQRARVRHTDRALAALAHPRLALSGGWPAAHRSGPRPRRGARRRRACRAARQCRALHGCSRRRRGRYLARAPRVGCRALTRASLLDECSSLRRFAPSFGVPQVRPSAPLTLLLRVPVFPLASPLLFTTACIADITII